METYKDTQGTKELLHKYLENKCTPEEEQKVLRWYFSFNGEDDFPLGSAKEKSILNAAKASIAAAARKEKNPRYRYPFFPATKSFIRIAALILIVSSVALGIYYNQQKATTAQLSLKTAVAERKSITLADGTKIWLGNASVLRYPAHFKGNSREVELEGEAFFKVTHNPDKPFLIHTRKLKIQVLGTSFNVRAYASDEQAAVNVSSGKVAVSNGQNQVMLEKGQGIIYNDHNDQFGTPVSEGTYSPAWLRNTLYFRYETLRVISLRLERWYGVKFEITDPQLLQKRYTLEQQNETLENVMKVLSAGDFNYQIKDKTVKVWK